MKNLENKLQTLYNQGGYEVSCDNRSYFTKSINKALSNKSVEFTLVRKGYVRTQKSGYNWNLRIRINGKGRVFDLGNDVNPERIAECFASVTKMDHVKEIIHIHEDACLCMKCNGKGIIPSFMHVCKGVCFECLGIGYTFRN